MAIHRGRTFRNGNSEAIRLPKEMAFGVDVELLLVRSGDVLTIYRAPTTIAAMIERLRAMPAIPAVECRDTSDLPDRPGL